MLLSIWPAETNFSEIRIETQNFSLTKMHLNILSAKWRPFSPGREELIHSISGTIFTRSEQIYRPDCHGQQEIGIGATRFPVLIAQRWHHHNLNITKFLNVFTSVWRSGNTIFGGVVKKTCSFGFVLLYFVYIYKWFLWFIHPYSSGFLH